MKKGIVNSSRDCLENGDNFSIFKREFKYMFDLNGWLG